MEIQVSSGSTDKIIVAVSSMKAVIYIVYRRSLHLSTQIEYEQKVLEESGIVWNQFIIALGNIVDARMHAVREEKQTSLA